MIAQKIWQEKYRHPSDQSVQDTFKRVARGLASCETTDSFFWETKFYNALENYEVLPAGRILAGAGTGRNVTLMNCFVMGTIPDSMSGIMRELERSALSSRMGGGIGMDFSTIRGNGALIKKLGVEASGPLAMMGMWDAMCKTIMSAGHRRGAMMGTLRCDHPDIEAFIDAKRTGLFKNFNLSVLVTDGFMRHVECNDSWALQFGGEIIKTVRARELWDKIMRATYDVADPGVIFIDRINQRNPLRYAETISCTNPCGEQPLPPYGSCCLGSINLSRLVSNPFTEHAQIMWDRLAELTTIFTRMLDNVITVTEYPLPEQLTESHNKRRIGIGITGFADLLAMLGISYGKGENLAHEITRFIANTAHEASVKLGEEKGSFPLFDAKEYGCKTRRNSHLTSIAPTGTISLFAGNVSSGIEPIFDLSLKRKLRQPDDSWQEVEITDYAWGLWERSDIPQSTRETWEKNGAWKTAAQITPEEHLAILAAVTPNVDSSVSKTVNLPVDISFEDFKDIYSRAYALGCKSCTTYRPNETTGSILSSDSMSVKPKTEMIKGGDQGAIEVPVKDGKVVQMSAPLTRPDKLVGTTYRLKPAGVDHALFVTINDINREGRLTPFEMFINTKSVQHVIWTTALTRMISAIFRKGGDISFVVEELIAIFDPRGGYWANNEYTPSLVAGIGKIIEQHLLTLGSPGVTQGEQTGDCPNCPNGVVVRREGCWSCNECDYAKCG